jgi:hypothetical protein
MILDWPVAIVLVIFFSIMAAVAIVALTARHEGGGAGPGESRGDVERGTSCQQPQGEGAPRISRLRDGDGAEPRR